MAQFAGINNGSLVRLLNGSGLPLRSADRLSSYLQIVATVYASSGHFQKLSRQLFVGDSDRSSG